MSLLNIFSDKKHYVTAVKNNVFRIFVCLSVCLYVSTMKHVYFVLINADETKSAASIDYN